MRRGGIFSKGRTGRKAFAKRRLFDCGPAFEARHERGVILSGVIGNSFHQMAGRAREGGGCFAHSHTRSSFWGSLTFLYVHYAYGLMNRSKIMEARAEKTAYYVKFTKVPCEYYVLAVHYA
jgi:hypothetical protein